MKYVQVLLLIGLLITTKAIAMKSEFKSRWQHIHDGHYLGQQVWANPLQDWRVKDAQAQCYVSGGERNIFILTHEVTASSRFIELETQVTSLDKQPKGSVGVRLGVQGQYHDYRDSAIRGLGLKVGVNEDGQLFIGQTVSKRAIDKSVAFTLNVQAHKQGDNFDVALRVLDSEKQLIAQLKRSSVSSEQITGGVGLFCHAGDNMVAEYDGTQRPQTTRGGEGRYAFNYFNVSGDLEVDQTRAFGPIAFTAFSLSDKTLKMTAQMMPVPLSAGAEVTLQMQFETGNWQDVQSVAIDPMSRTAQFRVQDWQHERDIAFRVRYQQQRVAEKAKTFYYPGTISKEPAAAEKVKVASLSCQLDKGFPHQDMVSYIASHNPDMFLFTGDQYYESNAGYGVQWSPVEAATLDYLRKWYQFGWAFRELYRDVPSIFLADDHDYFHGNLWGDAGKQAQGKPGADIQDSGGFKMPPQWINAVQRSMTSHLPDPHDPTPVLQEIGVYYTAMNYGGLSLAILEDRKWKTSPRQALPEAKIVNGFSRNLQWDARTQGDIPGADLLGERQMNFLEQWSEDWSKDARMKAVISQTLFASVQTRPREDIMTFKDRGMRPIKSGHYPEDDVVVQDFDTNGWPQTPRTDALKLIRKANAFHIAGDTHLGLTLQYGIDGFRNGPWAIGSPAVSNIWPRRWFPKELPLDYVSGQARNFGNYYDAFGNEITVQAAANPQELDIEPVTINERAPGYNILVFDNQEQTVEVQTWPRWIDPQEQAQGQFPGWPITLSSYDNGYPKNGLVLTYLTNLPEQGAVVQVLSANEEVLYTMRHLESNVSVKVEKPGKYLVRIFDGNMQLLEEREASL
ncbi:alkaline phosphatase D family protein [Pseudoalteromonas pernae]|uniref:alkaline phosphatase D family protein n=1 Tax=Pseudoalteromonas pernae TaxID=3118054 RepID=UPI003241BB6C